MVVWHASGRGVPQQRLAPFAIGAGHADPPAEALSYFAGLSSLPKYCLTLSGLWFCTGIALDAARDLAPRRWQPWIPVPIAMAIPMYLVRPLWPICKSANTATDFLSHKQDLAFPSCFHGSSNLLGVSSMAHIHVLLGCFHFLVAYKQAATAAYLPLTS